MPTPAIRIQEFNTKEASQLEYAAFNKHTNHIHLERLPNDPLTPLDETIQNLQSIPDFAEINMWAVWKHDQSEIIALGIWPLIRWMIISTCSKQPCSKKS